MQMWLQGLPAVRGVPFYTFPPPDEVWTLKSELKLLLDGSGSGSLSQTSRAPPLPRRHEDVHRELSLESFPDLRRLAVRSPLT